MSLTGRHFQRFAASDDEEYYPAMSDAPSSCTRPEPVAEQSVVGDVARMISEWEDSAELTTAFARRLVEFVLKRTRQAD